MKYVEVIDGHFCCVLSENGIQEVAIYEDRNFLAAAKLGLSSPEAQKAHPNFTGSAKAGWRFASGKTASSTLRTTVPTSPACSRA